MPRLLFLCVCFCSVGAAQKAALAVVEKIAGRVSFYAGNGTRIGAVTVDKHPHEIVASPDGRYLYVSNNGILWMTEAGEGGNTISILETGSMRKVGTIDLGSYRRPHGLDIDPKTGRLAATIENPDGLLLIDSATRKVLRKYDVQGADPHMVLFGRTGDWAYVSNTGSNTMAAVHLASGKVKLIPTDARPQGMALSHDGNRIFVTCSDGGSILVFDTNRHERVGRIATGKGPGRVVLTPDGKTLIYNLQAGEAVGFADVAGLKQIDQISIGGRPLSLTMPSDAKVVYAGIQDQDRIVEISVASRKILREIATPPGSGPDPALPLH